MRNSVSISEVENVLWNDWNLKLYLRLLQWSFQFFFRQYLGFWKHPKLGFSSMDSSSHDNLASSEKDKIAMNVCEQKAIQQTKNRQVSCENLKFTKGFPVHELRISCSGSGGTTRSFLVLKLAACRVPLCHLGNPLYPCRGTNRLGQIWGCVNWVLY